MVRTREDMLLAEECEDEEEEKEEEGWCPLAMLEEHNLEWVIQVNYSASLKISRSDKKFQRIMLLLDLVSLHVARQVCKRSRIINWHFI